MQPTTTAEESYRHALRAARKAIRAGDIALAERWVRIADRHTRLCDHSWAMEGKRLMIRYGQKRFEAWKNGLENRAQLPRDSVGGGGAKVRE